MYRNNVGKRRSTSSGWFSKTEDKPIEPGTGIRVSGQYGKTWWSQQWLDAFSQISEGNRLARGRAYAGNGAIREFNLEGSIIRAKVLGALLYSVEIRLPTVDLEAEEKVVAAIGQRQALVTKILSGELPKEVYAICVEAGLQLLPQRWADLKASCSCHETGLPCKHLAAALYVTASQIDANPFLFFELHRFDLPYALQSAGFNIPEITPYTPLALAALWQTTPETDKADFHFYPAALQSFDLSTIADCREKLLDRLPEKPGFYPEGNFKTVLKKVWNNLAKRVPEAAAAEVWTIDGIDYQDVAILEMSLDDWSKPLSLSAWNAQEEALFHYEDVAAWCTWLAGLPEHHFMRWPHEVRALWLARQFAETLVRQGAIVPQLLDAGDGFWIVRWLPALVNEAVSTAFQSFAQLIPAGLLYYEAIDGNLPPLESDYAFAMVAVFIGHAVQNSHGLGQTSLAHPINQLFFKGQPIVLAAENSTAIGEWLKGLQG